MKENRTFRGQFYEFETRAPFLAALMFDFFSDREAREMIFMKDSQSMTTSIAIFCMAWMLVNEPGNVIYITNTRDKVNEFGRDRLAPVFDSIPELSTRTVEAMDDKSAGNSKTRNNSTAMAWRFPGGVLYLGGGQSTASLVSTPAAWVILDEVSKHPFVNQMSTIDLGRSRLTGDDDSKLFAFSTPEDEIDYVTNPVTNQEEPAVRPQNVQHLEYLGGTQERCEVECPHCHTFQELVFEQLRFGHCKVEVEVEGKKKKQWDRARVLTDTWYQCKNQECPLDQVSGDRGRIDEHHKAGYFARHFRWVARNANPTPGIRSAAISSLYNVTHQARSWGRIASAFIKAEEEGGSVAMKSFYTDFLGKPFKQFRISSVALDKVMKLRGTWRNWDIRKGEENTTLPFTVEEMNYVGMICDVQAEHLKWVMVAFALDGRIHVLSWGDTGELDDVPDIAESREWRAKPAEGVPEEFYGVRCVFIDTGHKTQQVYALLATQTARQAATGGYIWWEGIRGMADERSLEARLNPWWMKEYPVLTPAKLETGAYARVNCINSEHWEDELYIERIYRDEKKSSFEAHPALILPLDVSEEFMAELCNAKKDWQKDKRGRSKLQWGKIKRTPNDFGDLMKYSLVMEYSWKMRVAAMEENEA